jgi:CheY-like chemotaxis protein
VALSCLIVDDNAGFLDAARLLLERQGIAVVGVASTSDKALRRAHELQPDVMLVDIDLGRESGFDLARRLAAAPGLEHVCVVLVSMYAEKDFTDLIAASPAVGFVSKPALSASVIYDALGGNATDGCAGDGRC